mmetsp:Transcript_110072/g.318222  ORF Transcript_110072/g.318222 Transcript_110072/m.318222 type:complete len:205 (+) Transcript_110072:1385-1999(+)
MQRGLWRGPSGAARAVLFGGRPRVRDPPRRQPAPGGGLRGVERLLRRHALPTRPRELYRLWGAARHCARRRCRGDGLLLHMHLSAALPSAHLRHSDLAEGCEVVLPGLPPRRNCAQALLDDLKVAAVRIVHIRLWEGLRDGVRLGGRRFRRWEDAYRLGHEHQRSEADVRRPNRERLLLGQGLGANEQPSRIAEDLLRGKDGRV